MPRVRGRDGKYKRADEGAVIVPRRLTRDVRRFCEEAFEDLGGKKKLVESEQTEVTVTVLNS